MEETRTKPTASQMQVLMSDWMGNLRQSENGHFTHQGKGGIHMKGGESIADYLIPPMPNGANELEAIRIGRQTADKVINVVSPRPVTLMVGGSESFTTKYEDKDIILLATDYFDRKDINTRKKIEIMLGLAVHEGSHIAYTEDSVVDPYLLNEQPATKQLKQEIWNILEDERIEYLTGDRRPGYAELLAPMKEHYFKRLVEELNRDGKKITEPIPKFISAVLQAVRYPSELDRADVEELFDEMDTVRKILTPYPLTTEEVISATDRIMDVIRKMARKEAQEKKQQQQQQGPSGQGGAQGDGQQQSQGGGQDDKSGGKQDGNQQQSSGNGGSQSQDGSKDQKKPGDGKGEPAKPPKVTQKEVMEALKQVLESDQGKKIMNALKKDRQKANAGSSNNASPVQDGNAARYANEDDAAVTGAGYTRIKYVLQARGDYERYRGAMNQVRQYVPAMSKALACKSQDTEYILQGQPSGKLNTNKLYNVCAGNYNVFTKRGEVKCTSASVCLVIDESGSMRGIKETEARNAAVLINEAIKRIDNVRFFCYGYSDNLAVYAETGREDKFALGSTSHYNNTPTGEAMSLVHQRVRRLTSDPVLLLVLTDGAAADSERVREMDRKMREDGFIPIGVGILCDSVKSTFKEYIEMDDISKFALELASLTKGKLDNMLHRYEA